MLPTGTPKGMQNIVCHFMSASSHGVNTPTGYDQFQVASKSLNAKLGSEFSQLLWAANMCLCDLSPSCSSLLLGFCDKTPV